MKSTVTSISHTHLYSGGVHNKKIVVMGPLPPPLGGISVHVARLIEKLRKQQNVVHHWQSTAEYRYRYFLLYLVRLVFFLLRHRPHLVYFHTLYLKNGMGELRVLIALKKALGYKVVLVEHDCRYITHTSTRWKKRLSGLIPSINEHIFIGLTTFEHRQHHAIREPAVFSIEGAFIPPDYNTQENALFAYPEPLKTFMFGHKPLIFMNAFKFSLLQGKDLYGIDQALEALALLKAMRKNIGLVIVLAEIGDSLYEQNIQQQISTLHLEDHVFILTGNYELWPLFIYADIFIRPTLSDGASVSVMEALYAGVPVVASCAATRPPEAMLYKTGDVPDLCTKILITLHKGVCCESPDQLHDHMHT